MRAPVCLGALQSAYSAALEAHDVGNKVQRVAATILYEQIALNEGPRRLLLRRIDEYIDSEEDFESFDFKGYFEKVARLGHQIAVSVMRFLLFSWSTSKRCQG
eukprot:10858839-Karenia_brevis.AAC.1